MTGFPVCGKLAEFMKFVWERESWFLFKGRNLIASKCSSKWVKVRLIFLGNSKMARTE